MSWRYFGREALECRMARIAARPWWNLVRHARLCIGGGWLARGYEIHNTHRRIQTLFARAVCKFACFCNRCWAAGPLVDEAHAYVFC